METKVSDLHDRLEPLDQFLNFKIFSVGNHSLTPGTILTVVLIIFFSWLFIRIIKRVVVGGRNETSPEYGSRASFFLILKYILYVLAIVFSLEVLGVNVNALLVGSAALLVGIGMGLQNIFSDLVSGLFLLFERPVELGDIIEVDGHVGRVHTIKLRHTVILDRDGVNMIVPNHKFVTENVINWSHNQNIRRFVIKVSASYDADPRKVTQILETCAEENPSVVTKTKNYEPNVRFAEFGESGLHFELFFWSRKGFISEEIKSDIRYSIFEAFAENGIKIPYPQRDIHIVSDKLKS